MREQNMLISPGYDDDDDEDEDQGEEGTDVDADDYFIAAFNMFENNALFSWWLDHRIVTVDEFQVLIISFTMRY